MSVNLMDFLDRCNAGVGLLIVVLSTLLGEFWFLFALYLLFNVLDWLTGWARARQQGEESSAVGLRGILKKLGYWVIVLVAFTVPVAFVELGRFLGLQLHFLELIGWYTLACLLVNELRSILENLVELGYEVPAVLIRGLSVTDRLLEKKTDEINADKTEEQAQ